MTREKETLIVIPIYNEQEHINNVISSVMRHIDKKKVDVLVIDDGSTDNTSTMLNKFKGIIIIRHNRNEGYGKSLIDGFKYGVKNGYKYVLTMDCDRQHEPSYINKFLECIKKEDVDILSGSRYLKKSDCNGKVPEHRRRINKRITEKINKITKYGLTDTFCGFKVYKTDALKKMKLTEPGYGLPIQAWIEAYKNNLKVKEMEVDLIYVDNRRNFNNIFKNHLERYRYYLNILNREVEKLKRN